MDFKLTEKEIYQIWVIDGGSSSDIAKAAQKKLVEWLETKHLCPSMHDYRRVGTIRQDEEHRDDCRLCKWQELRKGVGLE